MSKIMQNLTLNSNTALTNILQSDTNIHIRGNHHVGSGGHSAITNASSQV
jgi:hypothetical protein